jgi:ribosome-associated protein
LFTVAPVDKNKAAWNEPHRDRWSDRTPDSAGLRSLGYHTTRTFRDIPMDEELQPSKTRRKRQMQQLQEMGEELAALSADQIAALMLPDNLRDALLEAKRITRWGAMRRQMQYVGRLMREVDTAPIREQLDAMKGLSTRHTARLHAAERWRERLLEDDAALAEFLSRHAETDPQRLRALIRNARRETKEGKPPKSYRELFRAVRDILDHPP